MSKILNALKDWGDIEWAGGGGDESLPVERRTHPPLIAVRFCSPTEELKKSLKDAIDSYDGIHKWEINFDYKNWVIRPYFISNYMKENDVLGDRSAAKLISDSQPELGISSNKDLIELSCYLSNIAKKRKYT